MSLKRKAANPLVWLREREVGGNRGQRLCGAGAGPQQELRQWAEADLLRHCTSTYCNPRPPPRSTIATAFSPDGRFLASTHGDHTVKITCCRTGACLKVFADHQRTPWVVRFHPRDSNILASGSLDSFVRVWDLRTGRCVHSHQFGRPIASLAFHAEGDELAVASGHRIYIWRYAQPGLTKPVPVVVLKTRRSLRAVHFHPQGAPLILTAEVNAGANSRRGPLPVESTGLERRRGPPATGDSIAALEVRLRQRWLEQQREPPSSPAAATDGSSDAQQGRQLEEASGSGWQGGQVAIELDSPMRPGISLSIPGPPGGSSAAPAAPSAGLPDLRPAPLAGQRLPPLEDAAARPYLSLSMPTEPASLFRHTAPASTGAQSLAIPERRPDGLREAETAGIGGGDTSNWWLRLQSSDAPASGDASFLQAARQLHARRDLGFLQRQGQQQQQRADAAWDPPPGDHPGMRPAGAQDSLQQLPALRTPVAGTPEGGRRQPLSPAHVPAQSLRRASVPAPSQRRLDPLFRTPHRPHRGAQPPEPPRVVLERISSSGAPAGQRAGSAPLPELPAVDLPEVIEGRWSGAARPQPPQPAAAAATAGAGLGEERAGAAAAATQAGGADRARAASREPQAAAAGGGGGEVPCHVLIRVWRYDHTRPAELGPLLLAVPNAMLCSEMGAHISPCGRMLALCAAAEAPAPGEGGSQHELRILSLQAGSFGQLLHSRPIRAAHCMTSIQFSPCSQHVMLAYGRRHISLLRSMIADNMTSIVPVHIVLEVYRVADMAVVRVLPSADDEVNTAGFHPFEGGGIAYGTKEGRLRILTHSGSPLARPGGSSADRLASRLEDELLDYAHDAGPDSSDDD